MYIKTYKYINGEDKTDIKTCKYKYDKLYKTIDDLRHNSVV